METVVVEICKHKEVAEKEMVGVGTYSGMVGEKTALVGVATTCNGMAGLQHTLVVVLEKYKHKA